MGFKVVPDGLVGFAEQIERGAGAAYSGKNRLNRHADLAPGGYLMALARRAHGHAVDVLGRSLE